MARFFTQIFTFGMLLSLSSIVLAHSINTATIESITGLKGHMEANKIFKLSSPRDDLKINVNGVKISAAMGLTSWISFRPAGKESFLQGDLVLTADQINPLMSLALNNGVQVTSLQNHFLWENPQVVFMHIECVGKEANLAQIVNKLFAKIKATNDGTGDLPFANMDPAETTIDPSKLNKILGLKGTLKDGVYKISLNNEKKLDADEESNPILDTWAAFVGTNDEAAVDGNFMVDQAVLQRVLVALNKVGIYVVGIHQDVSDSDSSSVFIHYWGIGNTKNLAKGIRNVLDLKTSADD